MKRIIILDNGHGSDTPGKRSPQWADGSQLFEYEFNRDVVQKIARRLENEGIAYELLVPELVDVPLGERCKRANRLQSQSGVSCILISIHANAGGGTGWECYTTKGNTMADKYATILYNEARLYLPTWQVRSDYSDGDPDKESQFYLLKHTVCPAILSENLFMDTERDCRYILSSNGRWEIANMHVSAIRKMLG
jgi:N-acetylmuramoyl-L-alanine amidase